MKAKPYLKKLFLLLPTLAVMTLPAEAQLVWRISVKFILDANDERPIFGGVVTDDDVRSQIDAANEMLRRAGRGYEFQLTEIADVRGVSQWFDTNVPSSYPALDTAAKAEPSTYLFRANAINVYINGNLDSQSICSYPSDEEDIIFVSQNSRDTTIVHESGHYFDLRHTHYGESDCDCEIETCSPGNGDSVADTLPDHSCWKTDTEIAQFSNLPTNDSRVIGTYLNLMSYRSDVRDRFTPDQLDRMTDASNGPRFNVTNGRTRFVRRPGSGLNTVAAGVNAANNGDIVLLRAGQYNEPGTYTKPVTFRATRGNATIGQ